MSLFRKEVAEARQQESLGSVQLTTTRLGWAVAALAAVFVGCLLVLLIFGQYTRSERVAGHLVPASGLALITAEQSGRVVEVAVSEGDMVEAGQPLVLIDTDREASRMGLIGEAVATQLLDQRARLQEELSSLEQEGLERERRLEQRLALQLQQMVLIETQLEIRGRQVEKARDLLARIEPIRGSGQLSALQLHQYESLALEAESQLEMVRLSRLQASREIGELEEQLHTLPQVQRSQRNDLKRALAEVGQALARNAGEEALVLRAARSGRVSGLNVHPGQTLTAGQQVLAIIPEGSELHAELWVPARAIGRIQLGGQVSMRYHAFPYQQYGQQKGEIVEIAYRALAPEEVRRHTGVQVSEPAYRVWVRPNRQYLDRGAHQFPLRTSMTLEASLLLDRRRLVELLGFRPPAPAGRQLAESHTIAEVQR